MKEYHIFSMGTTNYLPFFRAVASGLKHFKKEDSKYIYHVFALQDDLVQYYKNLDFLISDDFKIEIESFTKYQNIIKSPHNQIHWSTYFKCLVCSLFPNLDKILYLDIDLFIINQGLEEFMDADLTNYYANACIDIVPTYNNRPEVENCKVENYINTGVLMLNLKKMAI